MVRPTRKVAGQTMLQRQSSCQQRATDGKKCALHQRGRDRQTDAPLRLAIKPIPGKRFVILAVMHQFQQSTRHWKGSMHLNIARQPCLPETAIELAKLRHRKTMATG